MKYLIRNIKDFKSLKIGDKFKFNIECGKEEKITLLVIDGDKIIRTALMKYTKKQTYEVYSVVERNVYLDMFVKHSNILDEDIL